MQTAYLTKVMIDVWPMVKQMRHDQKLSSKTVFIVPSDEGVVELLNQYLNESPDFTFSFEDDSAENEVNVWAFVNQKYGEMLQEVLVENIVEFHNELNKKFIFIKFCDTATKGYYYDHISCIISYFIIIFCAFYLKKSSW
jgi:hypothetical protein